MGYLSCKAESSIQVSTTSRSRSRCKAVEKIERYSYSDLEAATNNFSDLKLLGRGSHGLVYKALLPSGLIVAVKKPSRKPPCLDFDNELHILSLLRSPSFVNLLGFTTPTPHPRLLVVEFMSNGTLYDILHKPPTTSTSTTNTPKLPLWPRRLRLALQVAKAVNTLHSHSPPVIHRDIKSANVLLDTHHNARLGDFGLALICNLHDIKLLSTPPAGTIGYLDPSYVTPHHLSTKTDVFSFGILLLEIISGRKAIDVAHSPPSILDWAMPLVRKGKLFGIYDPRIPPPKDPMVRKQLAVIAAKCVRSNTERRPSMKEIVQALEGLTKLLPLNSWNALTNPCLMVDNVAHPVGLSSRFRGLECGNLDDALPLKNPRRIYSDLGFRNNLMDLMAEPDSESEHGGGGEDQTSQTPNRAFSVRVPSERYRSNSMARLGDGHGAETSLVQLRKSIILEHKRSQIGVSREA